MCRLAANKADLPELSAGMIRKLRHLTIVSLTTRTKQIPYSLLLGELGLQNVRELEVGSLYLIIITNVDYSIIIIIINK